MEREERGRERGREGEGGRERDGERGREGGIRREGEKGRERDRGGRERGMGERDWERGTDMFKRCSYQILSVVIQCWARVLDLCPWAWRETVSRRRRPACWHRRSYRPSRGCTAASSNLSTTHRAEAADVFCTKNCKVDGWSYTWEKVSTSHVCILLLRDKTPSSCNQRGDDARWVWQYSNLVAVGSQYSPGSGRYKLRHGFSQHHHRFSSRQARQTGSWGRVWSWCWRWSYSP